MALLKTIKNIYGSDTSYWKIVATDINWHEKTAHITMSGWIDKEARDNGSAAIDQKTFDLIDTDFPFVGKEPQNEREIVYGQLKITDEFIGSKDC
ncbi:MAG: hypothetical protein HY865_22605 [Chloroflexi bacterium]|nr:hypothetical protein [Chloroflexota bacterium]